MMPCTEVRDLVALVPGSELPVSLDRAVRHHLADCVRCQRELGAHLAAQRALGVLRPEAQPPHPEFFATLRSDTLAALDRAAPQHRRPWRVTLAGALTAAALFLVGVSLSARFFPATDSWWRTAPPIEATEFAQPASLDSRIREVGYYYGLLGRHRMSPRRLAGEVVPGEMQPQAGTASKAEADLRSKVPGKGR